MSGLSLALSALLSVFASAAGAAPPLAEVEEDDQRRTARPMFAGRTAETLEQARERVEAHIARRGASPEEAEEMRRRFAATLEAKLQAASSEGEVSDREVDELRALAREVLTRGRGSPPGQ